MPRSRNGLWRLLAILLAGMLALAACGSDEDEGEGGQEGEDSNKVAKIGFIAPLSGDLSALGLGMRNSVELAIRQANEDNKIEGWRLEFAPEDDQAKADVGAQVASKLASDSAVVGVIGTLNSSVAQQVIPILDRANIAQVSPANTNDTLSRGADFKTKPTRPNKNYFRTATLDSLQGPFAADYAYKDAGKKAVAIVHDKKTYGQGLANEFKARFTRNGGRVVAEETINPGDKDFGAVISKIRSANPDIIFYGGEYPEASLLSNQAKTAGLRIPLFGGDGIYDKTYLSTAGAAAEGDLATSVGAPPEQLDSAKEFIRDYNAAGFNDPYSAYGPLSYDAANALIEALSKVLPDADAIDDQVRQDVIKELNDVSIDGATGKVSFDQYGDTEAKILTVYKVTGGAWKPEKFGELEGA